MSIIPFSKIRNVTNITVAEKERIYDFFQGALYCWCKNRPDEWFTVRDFLGGENFDWNGTPLIVLFNKHKKQGKSDADSIEAAGKDAGWIAKKVIAEDAREFETEKGFVRRYKWKK
ncbi:hypothetical protein ASF10_23105 [Flavobacterium sp. Leaf82]|uniref:hypothetical protein n=1 Tax=Flavobacterium sp. Leaf82 TaxID=1736238 RepID=UPI0006F73315|nr:hypothetical protein [Flavobacterium sp. Leaf82]KQO28421.1 hypothetical protein ASF10_23105 [Flavobacterium sp. Leaf82]